MTFKQLFFEFLAGIGKINQQMHNRLNAHELKMAHLDLLFERELRIMSHCAFDKIKINKYKVMLKAITGITQN